MTCGEAMDSDAFSLESTGGRSLILCYELIQRINQFAVCPTSVSFKSG